MLIIADVYVNGSLVPAVTAEYEGVNLIFISGKVAIVFDSEPEIELSAQKGMLNFVVKLPNSPIYKGQYLKGKTK